MAHPFDKTAPRAARESARQYATIVADPSWALGWNMRVGAGRSGKPGLPYGTMSLDAAR